MNNLIRFVYDFVENNRKEDWFSFEDARKFNIVANQLEILKAQRDEARRMYCSTMADVVKPYRSPEDLAVDREWDCYKYKENA